MAKIHKNAEKFKIQWNGDVSQNGKDQQNDNIPISIDLPTWGAGKPTNPYVSCHQGPGGIANCTDDVDTYFFEDFDVDGNGVINLLDVVAAAAAGAPIAFQNRMIAIGILGSVPTPPNGPTSLGTATETEFTWGDVSFIQEIMDGIGSGSRRARQNRLNKLEKDKKKRLIHLICRVKGEKVYDDYTEIQDVEVKVDDVELIAETILKRIKLEIKENV
jgi:hypothetical protein